IVLPASEEEFPLQVGHLDQLGALSLLHPRVLERNEPRGYEHSFGIAEVEQKVKRLSSVLVGLTGQPDNERAEWKPVVPYEKLHAFEPPAPPLMGTVWIRLALHKSLKQPRAASLESDDRIDDTGFGIG